MTLPVRRRSLPRAVRVGVLAFIAATVAAAAALAVPGFARTGGPALNQVVYPAASVGGAVLLGVMALRLRGRERWAWLAMALGAACWAAGESLWQAYLIAGREVPYPGAADVLYVAGYPLLGAGVLLLPHVREGKYERLRLLLDGLVGAVALSILMWVTYLNRVIVIDPTLGFLENAINAFYGAGDVMLLITVMVLALRRSERRFDSRLLVLAAGLITTAVADVVYYAQVAADTYSEGSWLDTLWLLTYASFSLLALLIASPPRTQEEVADTPGWLRLVAPYGAASALFVFSLFRVDGDDSLLNWATTLVGGLIIVRQAVAIRENRELVERQRDDLVASVSHELRTPLTAIQGYAQLLDDDWDHLDDCARRDTVRVVHGQARHLGRIVSDLVETARDRLSSVELRRTRVRVAETVELAIAALSAPTRNQIEVEVDERLAISADRDRLQQIFVNLLTNAVRYGGGRVAVSAARLPDGVRFEIHDDGPGVPRKFEAAIWERFERGAHRFDSVVPGSGIGLPIVRALVEAHGGTVHQQRSTRLGGACFSFFIPFVLPELGARRLLAPAPLVRQGVPLRTPAPASSESLARSA